MKHAKKSLAIFMSIVLLLCAMPLMQASADSEYYESGPWEYKVENGEATITWFSPEDDLFGKVSVPSTLGGYPVTGIEWISCYGSEIDLYIPACITKLTDPEYGEFGDGIVSINVDESHPAFSSEDGVLFNKNKTELIRFPQESKKTSYTIPNSVVKIDNYAFEDCEALKSVTIPNSVTVIGNYAFAWCYGLESITIPDSITSIGDSAFWSCDSVKSVTIPDSVTDIGEQAFSYCEALESITIGSGITALDERPFEDCFELTSITVSESNPSYSSENGILFNKDKTELVVFPTGKNVTSYTIPDSVTTIGTYAFADCLNLKSVTIPNSVETIGEYSFAWCNGFENITMPDSVKIIEDSAFCGCENLKNVSLGNGVETIGEDAFYGCDSLTGVTISSSVTSIGNGAFGHCIKLTDIAVDTENQYYSSANGVLFSKDKTVLVAFPCGKKITSYTVPDGVTAIGDYAFNNCDNLTSVILPNSVTSIGDRSFLFCDNLKNITLSDSLTTIGHYAFEDCPLSRVSLPESVKFIGHYAFGWTDITKVYIPAGVEVLDYCAFVGCYNLEYIYYGASRAKWDGILAESYPDGYYEGDYTIDNAYKYFDYKLETASGSCGTNATWFYDGIDTLTISGSGAMASYPQGQGAPWNSLDYDIERLEIEEGITKIDGFYNLAILDTIILPESLERFESCAFCWDRDDTKEIIYKGMPEQWKKIEFETHESDGCSCYSIYEWIIYIDNEDFSIDNFEIIVDGSTNVNFGETRRMYTNIPSAEGTADGTQNKNYFIPAGTRLVWESQTYWEDDITHFILSPSEYSAYCDVTSDTNGKEVIAAGLVDTNGNLIYTEDDEPLMDEVELTSKAGIFEIIAYAFRSFFEMLLSFFMF